MIVEVGHLTSQTASISCSPNKQTVADYTNGQQGALFSFSSVKKDTCNHHIHSTGPGAQSVWPCNMDQATTGLSTKTFAVITYCYEQTPCPHHPSSNNAPSSS